MERFKLIWLVKAGVLILIVVAAFSSHTPNFIGADSRSFDLAEAEALPRESGRKMIQEKIPTEQVISKLEEYEQRILAEQKEEEKAEQPAEATPAKQVMPAKEVTPAATDSAKDEEIRILQDRIAELEKSHDDFAKVVTKTVTTRGADDTDTTLKSKIDENNALQTQQEKLIDQILEYRKQVKKLRIIALDKIQREKDLARELEERKTQSRELENQFFALQQQVNSFSAAEDEKDKLRADIKGTRNTVARLEEELEQKKSVETDNSYLRKQISDLEKKVGQTENLLNDNAKKRQELVDQLDSHEQSLSKLSLLNKQNSELTAQVAKLQREIDSKDGERTKVMSEIEDQRKKLSTSDEDLMEVKRQLSRTIEDTKSCQANREKSEQMMTKMADLEKALIKAKNDLMLKDTEIRVLAKGGRAPAEIKTQERSSEVDSKEAPLANAETGERTIVATPAPTPSSLVGTPDVMLVEVKVKKVNLRSGPGNENSPIMQVEMGARLTVESREGDWFRVITPTGTRAYIRADVVRQVSGDEKAVKPMRARMGTMDSTDGDSGDLEPFGKVSQGGSPEGRTQGRTGGEEDEATKAFESLRRALETEN